jgi:hypothetical protein
MGTLYRQTLMLAELEDWVPITAREMVAEALEDILA